jgi:hypothetical protein
LNFKEVHKYPSGDNYVDGSDKKNVQGNIDIVDKSSIPQARSCFQRCGE